MTENLKHKECKIIQLECSECGHEFTVSGEIDLRPCLKHKCGRAYLDGNEVITVFREGKCPQCGSRSTIEITR